MIKNKFKLLCLLPLSLVAITTPIILSSCSTSVNNDTQDETPVKRKLVEMKKSGDSTQTTMNQMSVEEEIIFPEIENIFVNKTQVKIINKEIKEPQAPSTQYQNKYNLTQAFNEGISNNGILYKMLKIINYAPSNDPSKDISLSTTSSTKATILSKPDDRIHKSIVIEKLKSNNDNDCYMFITPKLFTAKELLYISDKIEKNKNDSISNELYKEFISSGIFGKIIAMNQIVDKDSVGLFGFHYSVYKPMSDYTEILYSSFAPLRKNNDTYMYSYYLNEKQE